MNAEICTNPEDDKVFERLHWIATLSNGTNVYEDCEGAWANLKAFLDAHPSLFITNFNLRLRTHIVQAVPKMGEALYFCRGCLYDPDGISSGTYSVGYVEGDSVHVWKWLVPELEQYRYEKRELDTLPEPCIIRRCSHPNTQTVPSQTHNT